jgi:enamine deaminase RidA (YjgF/YER057c/UK114 family)
MGLQFAYQHETCASADMFGNSLPSSGTRISQFVFGNHSRNDHVLPPTSDTPWPLLWVRGDSIASAQPVESQSLFVRGLAVRRLKWGNRVVGSLWSDMDADYCWLAGIPPDDISISKTAQTKLVFKTIEGVLHQAGMSLCHVVRTWWFLENLLDWYEDFNAARAACFLKAGIFDHIIPASTGIGASNPAGAALTAGALAIRPKHSGVSVAAVESPLQCSALNYKSAFSRAVEVRFPNCNHLLVSGTASIAPGGASMCLGDVPGQIDRTMEVVQAILQSRGMNWDSTVRGIAYFKHMEDIPLLARYCQARGIASLPIINVPATVCRHDLLFEIEIDAIKNLSSLATR